MNNKYDPVTGKVIPVFFHYAIPSVIGILAATSAGVIDGIFIGNFVGATALAAVNISMPAFALFAAVVFMLAVGGSVMCGKFIGESDLHSASSIFSKTVYITLALALIISLVFLLFMDQLVSMLGANEELHGLVSDYMTIIVFAAPLLILGLTLDYFVRVDGRPMLASASLVAFAVINISLDYLLIVRLGWGIKGAAWATAIAECSIFFILLSHWFSARCNLKLIPFLECHRDGWSAVLRAAYNGFSEFANEMSIGLITLLFNWVMISRLGVEGVAAFTIISYLLYIGLEVCYGISESLQPTVSKNLGARQPERIVQFMRTAVLSCCVIGLLVSGLFLFFPEALISIFLREGEVRTVEIALTFIALFWPAFLFNGMNITLASYFTALHKPLQSATIAISRSLVLPALGLLFLPFWFGDNGVYMAIPLTEAVTFVVAIILVSRNRPSNLI
ncbi:MAG: MATE family efflux transporter [Xanthomonadales bacterium]|nr:MATE family efflux transporter [Xanthomonadales bacterium]